MASETAAEPSLVSMAGSWVKVKSPAALQVIRHWVPNAQVSPARERCARASPAVVAAAVSSTSNTATVVRWTPIRASSHVSLGRRGGGTGTGGAAIATARARHRYPHGV